MPTYQTEEPEEQVTVARKVAEKITHAPERTRTVAALATIGGAGSLSPDPFGVLVAGLVAVIAYDLGRKK
ncbi:MAG: hypothetical protein IT345_10745 [Trueperaceae bacterium]|nr:hypothetical protein [Trueperaceae bacterium]